MCKDGGCGGENGKVVILIRTAGEKEWVIVAFAVLINRGIQTAAVTTTTKQQQQE